VRRDHPSGARISTWPAAERYATNCVLSGMSPGGLLSAGTGDSVDTGGCELPVVAAAEEGAVVGPDAVDVVPLGVVVPPEGLFEQPAPRTPRTRTTAAPIPARARPRVTVCSLRLLGPNPTSIRSSYPGPGES